MAGHVREVVVYWRPGCTFCAVLRLQLRLTSLPIREINIWTDEEAAARVRSLNGGDETVPTVVVGSQALTNPTVRQIVAALRIQAPELVEAARARPRFSGAAAGAVPMVLGAAWIAAALWHPTTTYHLAPALVAAAAPAVRRLRTGPMRWGPAIGVAVRGFAVAAAGTAVLAVRHALAGPTLIGHEKAVVEAVIAAAVGGAAAAVAARYRRTSRGART